MLIMLSILLPTIYWLYNTHAEERYSYKLIEAINQHDVSLASQLLRQGANLSCQIDEYGLTPFIYAAESGDLPICVFFIQHGAKINVDVLSAAVEQDHVDVARLLLEHGANPRAKEVVTGMTPLHRVHSLVMAKLLFSYKADVNMEDAGGRTPLHVAMFVGPDDENPDIVLFFLKCQADVNVKDFDGYTPLDYAKKNHLSHSVKLLAAHNAKEVQNQGDE